MVLLLAAVRDATQQADVEALLHSVHPLVDHLIEEESLRNVKKSCENFAANPDMKIPDDKRDAVAEVLPDEFGLHKDGHIYAKRG